MTDQTPIVSHDTWSRAATVGIICFFLGFIVAILFLAAPEFRMTGFVMIIIFAFVIRAARTAFMQHEVDVAQSLQGARKDELALYKERSAAEQREIKLHQLTERANKQTAKIDNNYIFTSDDFDDAAKGLLLTPVKAARKANTKVTGQGLIETFLKGLR